MFRSFSAFSTCSCGLAVALVIGVAPEALGQRVARVEPGTVATAAAAVELPGSEPGEAVRYRITPSPGVILYVPEEGTATRDSSGLRIPVTFMVPATFPAGPATIAEIQIQAGPGSLVVPLAVEVMPRRAIGLVPDASPVRVSPGRWAEVALVLENRGNAPDTIALSVAGLSEWQPLGLPSSVVLGTGEARRLVLRLRAPESAIPGQQERLRVIARGTDTRATVELSIAVVPGSGLTDGLIKVPGTVTVVAPVAGRAAGAGFGGIAVSAAGEVAPGMTMDLNLRLLPSSLRLTPATLLLGDPTSSLEFRSAAWSFGGGTTVARPMPLAGRYVYSPGVYGSYVAGRYRVAASAGGTALFGGYGDRRTLQLAAGREEPWGRVELVGGFTDAWERYGRVASPAIGSGAIAFEFRAGERHRANGEVGWLWSAVGEARGSGLVADLSYRFLGNRLYASTRLRRVPGVPRDAAGQVLGDQFNAWARYRLDDGVDIYANAHAFGAPVAGTRFPGDWTRGATAGVEWRTGRLRTELGAQYQASAKLLGGRAEGIMAIGRLATPLWTGELDLHLGAGRTLGSGGPLDRFRVGYAVRHPVGRGWAALSAGRDLWGKRHPTLELGGNVLVERLDLQGGTSIRLRDGLRWSTSWLTGEYRITPRSSLLLAARYLPWSREPVEISVGLQARLGVPLPVRRAVRSGVLFEDRNANGVRDAGEPGLGGVRVVQGRSVATTGADGSFALPAGDRRAVQVDAATLPSGYIVAPDYDGGGDRYVAIPVVRPARVQVIVSPEALPGTFLEGDLSGVVVRLVDGKGRVLAGTTSAAGVVAFATVVPGTYRVEVVPPGRTAPTAVSTLVVAPGEHIEHRVAVPEYRRRIKMQSLPPAPGR